MKAIDLIRWAMQTTEEGIVSLVSDMRNAPLTQPTSKGGNHPLWVMGHLAYFEGSIPHFILGEQNPLEHWASLFGTGTQPTTDASTYPPFDEALQKFRELRAKNIKLLDRIGEAGLDQAPKIIPAGFEKAMKTVGQTFLLICLHEMVHYGQVTDARRVAGRAPLI